MSMYSTGLDQMAAKMAASPSISKAEEDQVAAAAGPEALAAVSAAKMRCGGCGGKVSACICIADVVALVPYYRCLNLQTHLVYWSICLYKCLPGCHEN